MSIAIDSMKCRACGKCLDVCPGSLIVRDPVSEGLLGMCLLYQGVSV